MKHRNPFLVLVFSIITFGIYDLYWLSTTRKVLNQRGTEKIPSVFLLIAPVIVLIAGVVMMIVQLANNANTTTYYDPSTGSYNYANSGSGSGLVLFYVGLLLMMGVSFYWFWKYSKAVSSYTSGQMSFPVAFLLLWVFHLIGVVFIQDQFNSHPDIAAPVASGAPQPAPQAPLMSQGNPALPPQPLPVTSASAQAAAPAAPVAVAPVAPMAPAPQPAPAETVVPAQTTISPTEGYSPPSAESPPTQPTA